jgi:hypothetical protein
MTENSNTELVLAAGADLLALLTDFPAPTFAASSLGQRLRRLNAERCEQARQALFDALQRRGGRQLTVAEGDEFVAITHRYMRAAVEGIARLNLQLLANVIAGQIADESLHASDFHRYADTICALSTQEIVYLGTMVRVQCEGSRGESPIDNFQTVEQAVAVKLHRRLVGSVHFPTDVAFRTCETALQRTGLVYRASATADGEEILALSPAGHTLARLAVID